MVEIKDKKPKDKKDLLNKKLKTPKPISGGSKPSNKTAYSGSSEGKNKAIEDKLNRDHFRVKKLADVQYKADGLINPQGAGLKSLVAMPTVNTVSTVPMNDNPEGKGRLQGIAAIGDIAMNTLQNKLVGINAERSQYNNKILEQRAAAQQQSILNSLGPGSGWGGFSVGKIGDLTKAGLTPEQARNASIIIKTGKDMGFGSRAITTALMTSLTESGLKNLTGGDRDSAGLFQQRPSQGWGSLAQVTNPHYSATKFYNTLRNTGGWKNMSPWLAAQAVQKSAYANGSNYRRNYDLAKRIMNQVQVARNTPGGTAVKTAAAGWINTHAWKSWDFDGAYGAQCVDLFAYYDKGFVGGNGGPLVVGAKDLWTSPAMNKNYIRVGRRSTPRMGDVVVYGGSMGGGYGHVGIVIKDNGGTLKLLHQNVAGYGQESVISNLTKRGVLGYWRPRRLA